MCTDILIGNISGDYEQFRTSPNKSDDQRPR